MNMTYLDNVLDLLNTFNILKDRGISIIHLDLKMLPLIIDMSKKMPLILKH